GHHKRRDYLEISLLSLDLEHPRDQRALEPCARAAQHIETRPREFYSAIEIDNSEILADFPMRERLERGELGRRSLGSDYAIVGLARAGDDVRSGDIGEVEGQLLDLPLRQTELRAPPQQGIAGIFLHFRRDDGSQKRNLFLFF